MIFSSITFIFYFLPITLILYYTVKFSQRLQNVILFLMSLIFYAWGEPIYVLMLLASIIINYFIGVGIGHWREKNERYSQVFLIVGCIINIGNLFVFKYLKFMIDIVNQILDKEVFKITQLALPIGISFFTFQALSYIIDVYRKEARVQKSLLSVGLYISLFPQLLSGPIVRYKTIEEQIINRKTDLDMFANGVCRFVIGLSKKVLLASNLGVIVDNIYNLTKTGVNLYDVPITLAWLGSIAYTLQIYMDFSGYSDMAIGLAQMFGFKFEENFNYPYITKSIREFWRRWHISLSMWFKEYVYFPLGGSRVSNKDKMVRNLLIVWLLTGIWHGSSVTFILWGIYNFIFILVERIFGYEKKNINIILKHVYALIVINFGWVIFRSNNLYVLGQYLSNMFGMNGNSFYSPVVGMFVREFFIVLISSIIFSMPIARYLRSKIDNSSTNEILVIGMKICYPFVLLCAFSLSIVCLIKSGYSPFIYFNF